MNIKKKLTVAIPVFNEELRIEKYIKTLISLKSFENIQILISDDCSQDRTYSICKKYSDKYKNINLYSQKKNFGMPVKNFQYLIEKCDTEYFMFGSPGDAMSNSFISDAINLLESDFSCGLVFGQYDIRDINSNKKIDIIPSSSTSNSVFSRYISRIIDMQPALIYGMFRTQILKKIKLSHYDFFEVSLSLKVSIYAKIKILNYKVWSWGIDSERKSHSIYPFKKWFSEKFLFKKKIKLKNNKTYLNKRYSETQYENYRVFYLPFYFDQIKTIFSNFSFIKSILIFIILTYFVTAKIIKVLIKPNSSDLNFKNL